MNNLWKRGISRLRWEWGAAQLNLNLSQSLKNTPHSTSNGVVLFYLPEAAVEPHLALLCILAKTLQTRGHSVALVRCYQLFERCPVMGLHSLPAAPSRKLLKQACIACAKSSFNLINSYGLPTWDLRAFQSKELIEIKQREIQSFPRALLTYKYDGVRFGQICAFQLALSRKALQFENPNDENRKVWQDLISTALTAYLLMQECLKQHSVKAMVQYNDYAPAMGAQMAVRQKRIPIHSVTHAAHNNVDRTYPTFYNNIGGAWLSGQFKQWKLWKDFPLKPLRIKELSDDSINNFKATGTHVHIYSPKMAFSEKQVHEHLDLSHGKKLVVAFTSSTDEMSSMHHLLTGLGDTYFSHPSPFKNQIEWIQALQAIAKERNDIQLCIRIHPREGGNSRNPIDSEHLKELRSQISTTANSHIIWPQEKISSYDLGFAADLVLISWSTIGLEFARVGMPVLATTNNEIAPIPEGGFLWWESTQSEYFSRFNQLLSDPRPTSIHSIKQALRWQNESRLGLAISLADVVPAPDYNRLPPFKMPATAQTIEQVLVHGESILEINRKMLAKEVNSESLALEKLAILDHLRRTVHFVMTGEDFTPPSIQIEQTNGFVTYKTGNGSYRKYSPHITRIVDILDSETLRFSPNDSLPQTADGL